MCSSKPSYTPPPPLPPPVQPRVQANRQADTAASTDDTENGERLRRMIAGVVTSPQGVLEPANVGKVKLGGA